MCIWYSDTTELKPDKKGREGIFIMTRKEKGMSSRSFKKAAAIVLTFFVAFSMMAFSTEEVSAASGKIKVIVYSQAHSNKVYVGERGTVDVSEERSDAIEILPIKSVTVSNKSMAKVKSVMTTGEFGVKYRVFYVIAKKPGKVKLTVKYKHKGKVKTRKKTITAIASPAAVQSLEINGSSKKVTGEKAFRYSAKCKKTKVSIKLTPSEGWEISGAYGYKAGGKGKNAKSVWLNDVESKIAEGKSISFQKKYDDMTITVSLMKGSKVIEYEIHLYR